MILNALIHVGGFGIATHQRGGVPLGAGRSRAADLDSGHMAAGALIWAASLIVVGSLSLAISLASIKTGL